MNCTKCYDKGWASVWEKHVACADFPGDETRITFDDVLPRFCRCDRGKQLRKIMRGFEQRAVIHFMRDFYTEYVAPGGVRGGKTFLWNGLVETYKRIFHRNR